MSIRVAADMKNKLEEAAERWNLPVHEIMRLTMNIGLIDLCAAQDIAFAIQQVATDKGASFLSWAKQKRATAEATTPAAETPAPEIIEREVTIAGQALKMFSPPVHYTSTEEDLRNVAETPPPSPAPQP